MSDKLKHEQEYLEFLKKRLASANYRANVTPEEFAKTKASYEKAKFKVKILRGK
jgi:hypothetical protein